MPSISVVIPVYNAAPFLREALDSLLAQTCGDFEAIAVNDGSTDNSLEILQEYAARDSRIRILDGPNGGYGKAMNRGMDAATGKYMAILEPDDYLPREAYSILLPLAEEHQLDVVRGTYLSFYEEGGERHYQYAIPLRRPGEVFCPRLEGAGVFDECPHIWTGLYSMSFLREYGIRFHESPGASYQDTGFFFLSAAYAERYMVSEIVSYIYRTDNPNSSINNVGAKRFLLVDEYAYIQRRLEVSPDVWGAVYMQFNNYRHMGLLWVSESLMLPERRNFLLEVTQRVQDWSDCGVSPYYRSEWERIIAAEVGVKKEPQSALLQKSVLGGLMQIRMSDARTEYRCMGVPIVMRKKIAVPRILNDGIVAMSDSANEYCILGIPVIRKSIDIYALPAPLSCVYAEYRQQGRTV